MSASCMPHAGICTASARQDEDEQRCALWSAVCRCLHLLLQNSSYFCTIYPALDIPFPTIARRCNPRRWRRYHISLCHITILGVWQARRCSAFLGVARRHRCLQVSTFTDLSVARRIRSVGSVGRRWQPQRAAAAGAGDRAMGWTTPPHHTITPKNIIAKFRGTRLVPYDLEAVLSKLNIKIRILILINPPFTNASLWVS